MTDSITPNLGLTLPTVFPGDQWGGKLNANFSAIDLNAGVVTAEFTANTAQFTANAAKNLATVAALLADTTLAYVAGTGKVVVATSEIVEAGGFRYQVAASGASDQHVTTAGGVKLYVQADATGYNVKAFGAVGDGVANDTAAIQATINGTGALGSIIYPDGTYKIESTITLLPQQHHIGLNAKITVASGVTAFSRSTDGSPGRIKFSDLRFQGTGNTGKAISITNNTPFVQIENCFFENFAEAVRLDGSYCSNFKDSYFSYNLFGAVLLNETHSSSLINCFFDGNTYGGLCINGDPVNGNLGSGPIHNVTTVGCAFQNSEYGVWAEECYEVHLINTYHEGNTKADLRLGVADAGAYGRYCYNFTVDGWQSASPCASGQNILIQHAVGGSLRGLAFNSGCSTTATLLDVDGFSNSISVDYHRITTAVPTTTAPFNFAGNAAQRIAVFNNGRALFPRGMLTAIKFGDMASQPEGVYSGNVSGSGRPALFLESVGSSQDMVLKVTDIERHVDASDALGFAVDHLNDRVETGYTIRPSTDNTLALGGSSNRWSVVYAGTGAINTSDEREKQQIRPIDAAALRAWSRVNYCQFKFNDAVEAKGDGARWHFGVIAQRVKEAFEAEGLDPFAYGVLCYDEWPATEDRPAGNRYGIRYEEALVLECAYLRSRLA